MGDRISMSISVDSPSVETLNRGPMALLLRRQYEFPFAAFGLIAHTISAIFIFIALFFEHQYEQ